MKTIKTTLKFLFIYIPVFIWNFKSIYEALEKMDQNQKDLMEG